MVVFGIESPEIEELTEKSKRWAKGKEPLLCSVAGMREACGEATAQRGERDIPPGGIAVDFRGSNISAFS